MMMFAMWYFLFLFIIMKLNKVVRNLNLSEFLCRVKRILKRVSDEKMFGLLERHTVCKDMQTKTFVCI